MGTSWSWGPISAICFLPFPFQKNSTFHIPVDFIPPTSSVNCFWKSLLQRQQVAFLLVESRCMVSLQFLSMCQHCPFPASHKSTFALIFLCLCNSSIKGDMKKKPCAASAAEAAALGAASGVTLVTPAWENSCTRDTSAEVFSPARLIPELYMRGESHKAESTHRGGGP